MAKIKVLGSERFDQKFLRKYECDVDAMGDTFQSNQRQATCKRCGDELESGFGIKHMATSNGWHFRRFYLCVICTVAIREHTLVMTCISPQGFYQECERIRRKKAISKSTLEAKVNESFSYTEKPKYSHLKN